MFKLKLEKKFTKFRRAVERDIIICSLSDGDKTPFLVEFFINDVIAGIWMDDKMSYTTMAWPYGDNYYVVSNAITEH